VIKRCDYLLSDILFIALCTLLSNGEDFEDMAEFGHQRIAWLKTKIQLPNGIPSHDTFNRVFQIIDPEQLSKVLKEDGKALMEHIEDKLVNLDGKKIRGVSPKSRGNKGLYILSAWVSESRLCIGQKKVQDKSNEITAVPELLKELDIEGCTVTMDAMGCQKEIASQIVGQKADYILSVKGNQGDLLEEISDAFQYYPTTHASDEQWEYERGRYENRRCEILDATGALSPKMKLLWPSIQTLVKIESVRIIKSVKHTETRYYISSHTKKTSKQYNEMVAS